MEKGKSRKKKRKDGHLKESVPSAEETQALPFFTKARVALALAIVKTKPAGLSGRENAEALARKLRSRDESWKEKAEGLQQEVLRLRQQLLLARVTSYTKSTVKEDGPDSALENVSQDLFDPSCDSETPDLLEVDPQPGLQPPSGHPGGLWDSVLNPNMQFLQSLCSLYRVKGNSRALEALWFSPDGGAASVLTDSVCQLLDSVVAACRNPPLLGPCDLVLQACQVAAGAMDLFSSQMMPSVEFMGHVEESLRELTGLLLNHNHESSTLQAAERLMEYLITLGSSSMSKSFLIRHILAQISALADRLWQAFQENSGLDTFPVDQYQNSCHLFWIVEKLLQKSKVEVDSEQAGFLSHLLHRVFLLSEEFPLFSICMWRIAGLLTSSDKSEAGSPRPEVCEGGLRQQK
ncbi:meiosis-specific protein MEI4 [Echeneis naucrates]|uniref:meiosis-specific protein MEI4 n=1 Tax=Echeneis naucrates TaxID=173247 RepID=UPI00111396CA|nr:meiosis-specific protein MEI4 [Echeneis naucrates]